MSKVLLATCFCSLPTVHSGAGSHGPRGMLPLSRRPPACLCLFVGHWPTTGPVRRAAPVLWRGSALYLRVQSAGFCRENDLREPAMTSMTSHRSR
jgi:hypothetical protein